jgi:hypothetical protein
VSFLFYFVLLLFLWYWGLNSGPTPWATPLTTFWDGAFQDKVSWTIFPGWLCTMILLISASWVARIIGVSHWCLAGYCIICHWNEIFVDSGQDRSAEKALNKVLVGGWVTLTLNQDLWLYPVISLPSSPTALFLDFYILIIFTSLIFLNILELLLPQSLLTLDSSCVGCSYTTWLLNLTVLYLEVSILGIVSINTILQPPSTLIKTVLFS